MNTTTSTLAFEASCSAASQLVLPLPDPALAMVATKFLALVWPPAVERSYGVVPGVDVLAKLAIFSVVLVPPSWAMKAFAAAWYCRP